MQCLSGRPECAPATFPGRLQLFPRAALSGRGHAALLVALLSACTPHRDEIASACPAPTPFLFPYVDPDPSTTGATSAFNGPAGGSEGAPSIAYPLDGAMHPVNIGSMTFQWKHGDTSSRVFRIRLDDGSTHYDFFVPCRAAAADCISTLPAAGWLRIAG